MRRLIKWLKINDSKEVRKLAFESAKEYYKDRQHTIADFQAYQRGFKNAYASANIDKIQ